MLEFEDLLTDDTKWVDVLAGLDDLDGDVDVSVVLEAQAIL